MRYNTQYYPRTVSAALAYTHASRKRTTTCTTVATRAAAASNTAVALVQLQHTHAVIHHLQWRHNPATFQEATTMLLHAIRQPRTLQRTVKQQTRAST